LEEIPEQDIDAIAVSSTRIRKALKNGEVEVAAQLLGYHYMH
jgi:riboflavin kinase/FMN adenylyltransferase